MSVDDAPSLFTLLWRGILSIVFPAHCALCMKPLEPGRGVCLCDPCWTGLPRVSQPFCPKCGRPIAGRAMTPFVTACGECRLAPPRFGVCRSPGLYEEGLKQCIHLFKYEGRRGLARPLGLLMAECVAREFHETKFDALVPVPLHRSKLRDRGFNQAELLARELGSRIGVPVAHRALVRVEARESQSTLARAARLKNVRGVFAVSGRGAAEGKRFLLIDDVFTTGATVGECARVLLGSGAAAVDVCALAIAAARSSGMVTTDEHG